MAEAVVEVQQDYYGTIGGAASQVYTGGVAAQIHTNHAPLATSIQERPLLGPLPTVQGADNEFQQRFNEAYKDVESRLQNDACAGAFGGIDKATKALGETIFIADKATVLPGAVQSGKDGNRTYAGTVGKTIYLNAYQFVTTGGKLTAFDESKVDAFNLEPGKEKNSVSNTPEIS